VERCQVCDSSDLRSVFFAGYLPPVNTMPLVGARPREQAAYPAELLICGQCTLAQLGLVVDPRILFPPDYPYTSGTTRILRENFADLAREVLGMLPIERGDLVVDIGSNDGTLLANFVDHCRVLGVEPTDAGAIARARGIGTLQRFFDRAAAEDVLATAGSATVVAAANVFAHMERIHDIVESVLAMLAPRGLFVTESHYFVSLLERLQYDTIYHEHLRYYTLTSLRHLLAMHGLEIVHARLIPTHGGSIRVYAARAGAHEVRPSVAEILLLETNEMMARRIEHFRWAVPRSKVGLHALLAPIWGRRERVVGIGAPSRASTLVNYVGLDGILEAILEVDGSHKIGRRMPGTLIPVMNESALFDRQPDHALLLSWHIADELIPKLSSRGYRGDFIIPLPEPRLIRGSTTRT
jgi:hypothetical protein